MWWRDLPPAGNPIAWAGGAQALPQFPGYRTFYVNSGTAALALALLVARVNNPSVSHPEVILPGYACPDLVAAAVYAGVTPVLADIGAHDPGYDLASLQQVLSDRVIAVIAVNFLGIRERLSELQECLRPYPNALLIEDNAQWFPEPFPAAQLTGAAVCLSFGRGKPVSLLGGGAMLLSESIDIDKLSAAAINLGVATESLYLAKVLAYNALLNPDLYGLVSRNPWLGLGRTRFKPLSAIATMDTKRAALLADNVDKYLQRSRESEDHLRMTLPSSINFSANLSERRGRLLRYPILCESGAQQQVALQQLRAAGLGATALYQRVLPEIEGVEGQIVVRSALTGARKFAEGLITLPLHSGVHAVNLRQITDIFTAL